MSIETVAERSSAPLPGEPGSVVPSDATDRGSRRGWILGLILILLPVLIVVALVVWGIPSDAASGGCGGG
ncbi:MAG TPA: hypothetical protein VGF84_11940 [Micromonosporaceae bacterium]|jgi:hypothetical protein